MNFGYHYTSFEDTGTDMLESVRETAHRVEAAGFDWFSLMDHLWQIPYVGQPDDHFFTCYSMLPAVAALTQEMRLGALVTCVHYRNPALLGKLVTDLDHISGGRAVLGIGAGWFQDEYEGYGIEYPDDATRISQMEDAVRLIKETWTAENPVSYDGEHYSVEDLVLSPKPVQDPHPPVLVGGGGEQLTLKATAKEADAWNVFSHPEEYAHKLSVLQEHCDDVGRNYDDIEKTVANVAVIRDTEDEAHDAYEAMMSDRAAPVPARDEYRGAVGTPEHVAATVEDFRDLGADLYIFRVPGNDGETIERFIDEVAPEFV
ncbi:MAG: 5,10-methylenetetrahydromethanopterin reductase [Methanonatronarchaeales archaeon]|nr:5,10-methylenetetrahydromethanopterin reductase [Methanonatronarchaeales archaeon]MBS1264022.1 5,10-methylenetetrahydromethanopterin reductase [Methanonatronarchaeales archaeon]